MPKYLQEPREITQQKTAMDESLPLIKKGHIKTIKSESGWVIQQTVDDAKIILFGQLGIHDRKPIWWDNRSRSIPNILGQPEFVRKALLMHRDMQAYFFWDDKVGPLLKAWLADKNSKEKRSLLEEVGGYTSLAMHTARETAVFLIKTLK